MIRLNHISRQMAMMTSSNGNIFRVTGPLRGESTDHRWVLTQPSDAELWCFLWSASEYPDWANNRDAGDLRRHRALYEVTVMIIVKERIVFIFEKTKQNKKSIHFCAHDRIFFHFPRKTHRYLQCSIGNMPNPRSKTMTNIISAYHTEYAT